MAPAPVSLCVRLFDQNELAAENTIPFTVTEPGTKRYQVRMWVDDPRLWSPDDPHLYTYRVSLLAGDHIVDEETGHFGVRVLSLDTKRGLCINGTPVKLRGGCIHHDNGIIGSREFHHAAESRIRAMKAAGYNAVRSAHYPMSKTVLDVCDQVGMLVMDEFADVWASAKTDFDYSLYIQEWWKHDIESML